ncbi:hypothetical protein CsatB_030058 [Cannabis sativa]
MRYYNSLLALFDNGVQEGFIKSGAQEIIFSAPTTKKFIIKMEPYAPSHEPIASLESSQMEQLGEYPNQDKSSDVSDYEDEESNFCIYHNVHNISYHYTSQ